MRTFRFWPVVTISAAIFAVPVFAGAQSNVPSANVPPPPQTMTLEEDEAPAVTITPPDSRKAITEKKSQGRVTEVKVKTGRSTYYAQPNDAPGAMRGDAQSPESRPVQFEVGTFGPPHDRPAPDPAQTLPPAPAR